MDQIFQKDLLLFLTGDVQRALCGLQGQDSLLVALVLLEFGETQLIRDILILAGYFLRRLDGVTSDTFNNWHDVPRRSQE